MVMNPHEAPLTLLNQSGQSTGKASMRPEVMNLLRRLKLAALFGVPAAGLGAAGYYAYKKATEDEEEEE